MFFFICLVYLICPFYHRAKFTKLGTLINKRSEVFRDSLGYNSHMKKISTIISNRSSQWLLGVLLVTMPVLLWARGDDLPIPIVNDNAMSATALVARAAKRWTIQLASGNVAVLEGQASKLRADWPDARVVQVAGQGKLVVGSWTSASEAAVALKALRAVNAQAFVRQLPAETAVTSFVSVQTHHAMVKPAYPAKVEPVSDTTLPMTKEMPQSPHRTEALLEPEKLPIVKDDDALPAVFAVAIENKAMILPQTPELQAAVELLEQEVGNLDEVRIAVPESIKQEVVPSAEVLLTDLPEKRGITLPMRTKEPIEFKSAQQLVEPLNLMLSPLYLLPDDTSAQAQHTQALTMKTVLEALVKPRLSASESHSAPTPRPDPALARKAKLFSRMAELANAGLWEMALPLVKEAKLKDMTLSAVDNLLLGWIWLQNKEPRVAKGYFQAALVQSPQDEVRYALGLCYLLLGEKTAAQGVVREMQAGQQKDHLRSLLLRQ